MAPTGQNWDNLSTNNEEGERISLVVQWLSICLLMQGMWVRSLVKGIRSHMLQLEILHATTKTWHSQINKYLKKRERENVIILGGGTSGRCLGHEGRALMNGISALIRDPRELP